MAAPLDTVTIFLTEEKEAIEKSLSLSIAFRRENSSNPRGEILSFVKKAKSITNSGPNSS